MSKGLLQSMAEFFAGATPDAIFAALQGNLKIVFTGSEKECKAECLRLRREGTDASVIGGIEMGEYMVTTKGTGF